MSFIIRHTHQIKITIWLIALATSLLSFIYVHEANRRFNHVADVLDCKITETTHYIFLLKDVSSQLGYNGFIHNFKNYVLRRDHKYFARAEENYFNILRILKTIELRDRRAEIHHEINVLKFVIDHYYRKLYKIGTILHENEIAKDDKLVAIDDNPATNSLDNLYKIYDHDYTNAISNAQQTRIKAGHFISLGYFVVLIIFANALFLLYMLNKLSEKSNQAQQANQAKSKFLSTMSHEIRTPLNGVLGLVQLLNLRNFGKEEKYHLELIQSSGELLLGILNDILDMSKIEAAQMRLEKVPLNISTLLQSTTEFYKNIASEKGLLVNFHNQIKDVDYINGDPTKIRQILSNILSNSIKFTEVGQVDVSASCILTDHDGKHRKCILELKITDTGIGMDKEAIELLFQKFAQADQSISRRYGGTGLGMSICKDLTELMGGKISVTSSPGTGTTFQLTIPFEISSIDEVKFKNLGEADYLHSLNGVNVIVAEDNMVNAVVAKGFLENLGMKVRIAHDGKEAIRLFERNRPDLILMDINMPEMDGLEATKAIRQLETAKNIPILALTADAFTGTKKSCLAAGMNGVISKPFTFELLRNRIYDVLQ